MSDGFNVMCNVSGISIDCETRTGYLYLPEMNFPDMKSTIRSFKAIDPEIQIIYTFVNGEPDVIYTTHRNDDGKWEAVYIPNEVDRAI